MRNLYSVLVFFVVVAVATATTNTDGHKGAVHTLSAKTNGQAFMDINVIMNYAKSPNLMYQAKEGNKTLTVNDAQYFSNSVNLAIGVSSFLDLAVSFPIYYDKVTLSNESYKGFGVGDLTLSFKAVYPPVTKKSIYYQALYLGGIIPVGSKEKGLLPKHLFYPNDSDKPLPPQFFTANAGVIKAMLLGTFNFGDVETHSHVMIDFNAGAAFAMELDKDHHLIFGGALRYRPHEVIDIFFEANARTRINTLKDFKLGADPFTLSPGLRFNIPKGTYLQIAGDFGLKGDRSKVTWDASASNDIDSKSKIVYQTASTPSAALHISLGWNGALTPLDRDKDGITDDLDRCPKIPEDKDGFEDEDGCPEDDNDKDGIKDNEDKCPNQAEDPDAFEDEDGCPETDNDKDGIADIQDKCPQIPEDFDGIDDSDGCPDTDNDKDGIPDSTDKCPNEPEDRDLFEDNDGCPDLDNDKDGIPDTKDKCPDKPELFNGVEDDDGCPEVEVKKAEPALPKKQILEGVRFRSGSSRLTPNSFNALTPLAELLEKNETITVEIRGHTDITGKYSTNVRLSQERANSVRNYLISRGIAPYRVRAIGVGPDQPIDDNSTMEGRARNRRIEVIRTDQ